MFDLIACRCADQPVVPHTQFIPADQDSNTSQHATDPISVGSMLVPTVTGKISRSSVGVVFLFLLSGVFPGDLTSPLRLDDLTTFPLGG